jgi:hypothetical protein
LGKANFHVVLNFVTENALKLASRKTHASGFNHTALCVTIKKPDLGQTKAGLHPKKPILPPEIVCDAKEYNFEWVLIIRNIALDWI